MIVIVIPCSRVLIFLMQRCAQNKARHDLRPTMTYDTLQPSISDPHKRGNGEVQKQHVVRPRAGFWVGKMDHDVSVIAHCNILC